MAVARIVQNIAKFHEWVVDDHLLVVLKKSHNPTTEGLEQKTLKQSSIVIDWIQMDFKRYTDELSHLNHHYLLT